MRVLVACEFSGIVRDAFRARGHDAWSCDLLPTEIPGSHFQEDVFYLWMRDLPPWDLLIAHPPCTHLAVSGARWFKEKHAEQCDAVVFFLGFTEALRDLCLEYTSDQPWYAWFADRFNALLSTAVEEEEGGLRDRPFTPDMAPDIGGAGDGADGYLSTCKGEGGEGMTSNFRDSAVALWNEERAADRRKRGKR